MNTYKITITKVIKDTQEEQKYPREETIYEQVFENELDNPLEDIIKAVNNLD